MKKLPYDIDLGEFEYDDGDNYYVWNLSATDIVVTPGEKGSYWDPPFLQKQNIC